MQINLDKTKLEEYKSQTVETIKSIGFSQKGYNSILRYDTWRQQKCLLSELTTDSEDIKDVTLNMDEWIDIIDLKEYVELIIAKGATHIFITGDSGYDINIDAIKKFNVKRDESEYYSAYESYVAAINQQNKSTWNNYKNDLEQDEKAEFKELQQFLDAKKVYEKLKHKFE
jgi:hypothetical protein